MRPHRFHMALVILVLGIGACATPRPVVYPNAQYQRVGQAAAERDVDDCMRRAQQFVSSGGHTAGAAGSVATSTAVGAGTGAAIGAVGGAVTGNAGEGAAVGAATGGTAGLLAGLLGGLSGGFESPRPDPLFANYVDRCLRERGYDPIGWK